MALSLPDKHQHHPQNTRHTRKSPLSAGNTPCHTHRSSRQAVWPPTASKTRLPRTWWCPNPPRWRETARMCAGGGPRLGGRLGSRICSFGRFLEEVEGKQLGQVRLREITLRKLTYNEKTINLKMPIYLPIVFQKNFLKYEIMLTSFFLIDKIACGLNTFCA